MKRMKMMKRMSFKSFGGFIQQRSTLLTGVCVSALLAILAVTQGCVGSNRHNTLGGMANEPAIVEAFIEYSGPGDRWAGPVSLLIHVSAKDGEKVAVQVSPSELIKQVDSIDTNGRGLASEKVSTPVMRDRLAGLAETIEHSTETFRACLAPLRVRVIRADGAVKEWQGCRASTGWPKAVSEFTGQIFAGV